MNNRKSLIAMAVLAVIHGPSFAQNADQEISLDFAPFGDLDQPAPSVVIRGIQRFDWQSTGDLVMIDQFPDPVPVNGVQCPGVSYVSTLAEWTRCAGVGDSAVLYFHAHARLNDFLNARGARISAPNLSRNGSTCLTGPCFEVSAVLSGFYTATVTTPGVLTFTNMSGRYQFLVQSPPNSKVNATNAAVLPGVNNFGDGNVFLQGSLASVDGSYTYYSTTTRTGGNNMTKATKDNVLVPQYVMPSGSTVANPLAITQVTFDNLIRPRSGTLEAIVQAGSPVGMTSVLASSPLAPAYVVKAPDLALKADANSSFWGVGTSAPGDCRVTFGPTDENENLLLNSATPLPPTGIGGDDYSAGGQVRVSYGLASGEFTHANRPSSKKDAQPSGEFVFRSGTRSAPGTTYISTVTCSKPVACNHARANGNFKQIYWEGFGSFRELGKNDNAVPAWWGAVEDHLSNYTTHFYRVRMLDLGEPGWKPGDPLRCERFKGGFDPVTSLVAPETLISGANSDACQCPDVYQLEIHQNSDPASAIIYRVGGYIDGGNIQMHNP